MRIYEAYIHLGVDRRAKDVAVGEVDGLAGAFLKWGLALNEVEFHWGCCDSKDERGKGENRKLHIGGLVLAADLY